MTPLIPRQAGVMEMHGRGLAIVEATADKWGVDPAPSGDGKTVWFLRAAR
jgi:hypothetical protein